MRRLGVDHGLSRVGLALSDEEGIIATPLCTLAAKDLDAVVRGVSARAKEHEVGEIVIGLPLALDGSEGGAARRARRFAERLEQATKLTVVLWDERLTTAQAERSLSEIGVRGARRREVVDQVAAALILQSYLDHQRATEG